MDRVLLPQVSDDEGTPFAVIDPVDDRLAVKAQKVVLNAWAGELRRPDVVDQALKRQGCTL
jgi:hypothetical protein